MGLTNYNLDGTGHGTLPINFLPSSLYAAQASRVAKLELAPALLLFKKVLFLLY